jgi:hypothetical protein
LEPRLLTGCLCSTTLSAALLLACPSVAQEPTGLAAAALANSRFSWLPRSAPGFRVYFLEGSYAARHQDSLLARLPFALQQARALLRTSAPAGPIDLFFVETREDMAQLVGAPVTGFAHQAARAVFLVTNPSWRAFERHEVMHVVAWHSWGSPAANTDWLQEGLAQAADGHCGNYTNEVVLRGLIQRGGWVSLEDLLTNFRRQPDLRAYLQAAAFTDHLLEASGPATLEILWRRGARRDTIVEGRPLAMIEQQWRARIAEGELPDADELSRIEASGCGVVAAHTG